MSYEWYQMMIIHMNNIRAVAYLIKRFIQFNITYDLK